MSTSLQTRSDAASASRYPVEAELRFVAKSSPSPKVFVEPEQTRYLGEYEYRDVTIHNARERRDQPTLDTNGFEVINHDTAVRNFEDQSELERVYFPEVEALVKQATGASRVLIFDATVRKSGNTRGRQPARHVHNDYTEHSAPQRVRDFLGDDEAAPLLDGDYAQINVWRSIAGPIERSPLAFLDAATLDETDLARTEIHNDGRIGEIYGLHHAPAHRWYSYPSMTASEVAVIKGFDSRDGQARFTPHTAFDDPNTAADAPARESIEVRTFAFFGK